MLESETNSFEQIEVGRSAQFAVEITDALVRDFADLTGDKNPLHTNAEYAEKSQFGERVAHGMLVASFFSRIVGMYVPGTQALYLSQQINFRAPVFIGARISIEGTVVQKIESAHALKIHMKAFDSRQVYVDGDALVKVLPAV